MGEWEGVMTPQYIVQFQDKQVKGRVGFGIN
jgi:hypothetical protein